MKTFSVECRPLPAPFIAPSDELRERLIWREAAAQLGCTPEDWVAAQESGVWPPRVVRFVADERTELNVWVDATLALVGE